MPFTDFTAKSYRNGLFRDDRTHTVIRNDGSIGKIGEGDWQNYPGGNTIMGDGPVHVRLLRMQDIDFYKNGSWVNKIDFLSKYPGDAKAGPNIKLFIDEGFLAERDLPCSFEIEGHAVELRWRFVEHSLTGFARLVQTDGAIWCGWTGFCYAGSGLPSGEIERKIRLRDQIMKAYWPDAISQ